MDAQALKTFLALPVKPDENWQGGIAELSEVMGLPADAPSELGLVLWRCDPSELVHAKPVFGESAGSFDQFLGALLEIHQEHGAPYRPARIECNDQLLADQLSGKLAGSGTVVHYKAKMSEWNAVLKEMAEHLQSNAQPKLPSLREVGCRDQQIREYAAAAAEFYRAKLWELLDDADLIKIESPRAPRYLKYAVTLGSGGQSYGLGFYDDAEDHHAMMAQRIDIGELSVFSFQYDAPTATVSGDAELWKELDLPLAKGEAFPDSFLFLRKGPRRPTPKELDFLTLVLKGLAKTTEAELDSGKWTKSVVIAGKPTTCTFSVPNLLNPPDRAEWIRRGKMPDMRGHEFLFERVQEYIEQLDPHLDLDAVNEAINAKFTGISLDDIELPQNTPAERAEAIYQQALQTFGRRRVVLAREALLEDPNHAAAAILIAESTSDIERRIKLFAQAQQAAAVELGEDFVELVGEFWGVHETRPYMRACHGLASALARAGQASEAIKQYQEMLRLNPNDNQGVRYELARLLLEQARDPEATRLLADYEEKSAHWLHLMALVEFRRSGPSAHAKKVLRAAFKANAHVMTLLQSDGPPLIPDSYSLGSPEEAAICLQQVQPLWEETDGYAMWLLQEYLLWQEDKAQLRKQKKRRSDRTAKRKWRR